jgi:uncharacterized protein (DUF58 family)
MESKPLKIPMASPRRFVFMPRTMGIFIVCIVVLAFAAGHFRQELILTLIGAVFLAVWAWCLVMTAILALIHGRRALKTSVRISPREIAAGDRAELVFMRGGGAMDGTKGKSFFRLPGILIRYRVRLSTADGRRSQHDFDPAILVNGHDAFTVKERGAYYSRYDEFAVFDALGFFRFAACLPQDSAPRLLASPLPAEEPIAVELRSGGTELRTELNFQRTDNLIEHRPYVPGDDPRRINWKLYGHGGELFVREGESEPPPHSRLLILIDTQIDPALYSAEAGRRAVDLLCANALSLSLACTGAGMDVLTGYTGGTIRGGTDAELAAALAWPFALPLNRGALNAEFPTPGEDRGVLILALPRSTSGESALDRFLKRLQPNRKIDLAFLYNGSSRTIRARNEAAETCAALYGRWSGVSARRILCK